MFSVDTWAEIRRLHRWERVPIKQIARSLGIGRNTVRRALRGEEPPDRSRGPRGSRIDAFVPQIRALLAEFPKMPATVIAERVGWEFSPSLFRERVSELRPEYQGIDPADRLSYQAGEVIQCDLWFPETRVPVGDGQDRVLPVLVMVSGFSRRIEAAMLPSRQGGDLTSGMWSLLQRFGGVPRSLLWDREAAIGGLGKPTILAATFAGTLATKLRLAPPRDPETKSVVERANRFLETSFLPGRIFQDVDDFNAQLTGWLNTRANQRRVRAIAARPVELADTDRAAMLPLPARPPTTGLTHRVRLARDYYVRLDGNDYSVDPRFIGRFVDATTSLDEVTFSCAGQPAGRHDRSFRTGQTITDPEHVTAAAKLRAHYQRPKPAGVREHPDGHRVQIRALSDYDALFGVDFTSTTPTEYEKEAQ
ncbi:IS21 family transposase [Herbiconiux moechotypicola]|uniref:IS21 family transposase n=1 Tax=Herbiconiux moechotypicola TaxID=637393 RepID=UPI00217CEF6A|nr:IS21 family transposase [Herbiconiux moechotypicola]MCS5732102.1 IS21 family transposase [Herbiconiux moechotypicola]